MIHFEKVDDNDVRPTTPEEVLALKIKNLRERVERLEERGL